MTTYLLAGGGTAGHVNPLLATADALRAVEPDCDIAVIGTREGLEARLVPARGYELIAIPRLPFPRKPSADALRFIPRFVECVTLIRREIVERGADAVVGFGGYASAPAILAARLEGVPIIVHEANAKPGLANRLASWLTPAVAVAFPNTKIRHATFVGMPLRKEIAELQRTPHTRAEGRREFGLDKDIPTLLVTGGSLGAKRINEAVRAAAPDIVDAGWQILHIVGNLSPFEDPGYPGYRVVRYCDRMDLALAAATAVISRAGAATVSELTALGLPAIYVPYAVGNGEQRFNIQQVLRAKGGIQIADREFSERAIANEVMPLLDDDRALTRMGRRAASVGIRDGSERLVHMIRRFAHASTGRNR